MSLHTDMQIVKMIENWPSIGDEHQINRDSILDFVIERMDGLNMYRFENIDNIVQWLCDGRNGDKKTVINPKRCVKSTFQKGTKIKIQKPTDSAVKFNDFGKAWMVYTQCKRNHQLNSGDSEEIDVTTLDNHASPWNSYAMAQQENRQNITVLTEIQPIATVTPCVNVKRKRPKSPAKIGKEPKFVCINCDKKYQQKSSLSRHEKKYHEIIHPSAKRPKNNNYNLPAPINTEM